MRIYNKSTLKEYADKHASAAPTLNAWYRKVEKADWKNPATVKAMYAEASFVVDDITVFNIGNNFRLVVDISYEYHSVFVLWFGTHSEYDALDVKKL